MKIKNLLLQENLKSKAKKFLKENRWILARIGLTVATLVIMPDSVSYAQTGTTDDTISVLTQPFSRMENLMAGPVPKAIVTIGVATGRHLEHSLFLSAPCSAIMVNALVAFLFIINFHFWYILLMSLKKS